MAKYIDRQAALDSLLGWAAQLTETYGKNDEYVKCLESAAFNIEQIPAADVRPVVLCRDCIHARHYTNKIKCGYWSEQTASEVVCADDFCSYGEKREES